MNNFGRNYRLTVVTSGGTLVYEPPMQIRFSCEIWPGNSGGLAQITLYGISRDTRKALYAQHDSLTLTAGYGDSVGLIFAGEIQNIETGREGPDQYIRFYARPTGQAQAGAFISKTWGDNTPQLDIIRDVAETLLLPIEFIGDFSGLPKAIKGRSMCVSSIECMNELSRIHDFTWFLGANRMVIVKNGAAVREGDPYLISAGTGMIGSPQILIQQVEVKIRLDSAIVPGDTVNIQAETRNFAFSGVYEFSIGKADPSGGNGIYKVIGVKHEGDFYGDTWSTAIQGRR